MGTGATGERSHALWPGADADAQAAAEPDAHHRQFFQMQLGESNSEFWRRMGEIDLRGRAVLEIGCGHGALSLQAAIGGAERVVGVDIDAERIAFARRHLHQHHPEHARTVTFTEGPLSHELGLFDVVISKDSFEHVADLDGLLKALAERLRPGGVLAAGFGPLYHSPFGDHGLYWGSNRFPWSPVLLPEALLMRLVSRRLGRTVRSPGELGLNKLTPAAFRQLVHRQGWQVESLNYNLGERRGIGALRLLRRMPLLEKYCTTNIYVRLRRPA